MSLHIIQSLKTLFYKFVFFSSFTLTHPPKHVCIRDVLHRFFGSVISVIVTISWRNPSVRHGSVENDIQIILAIGLYRFCRRKHLGRYTRFASLPITGYYCVSASFFFLTENSRLNVPWVVFWVKYDCPFRTRKYRTQCTYYTRTARRFNAIRVESADGSFRRYTIPFQAFLIFIVFFRFQNGHPPSSWHSKDVFKTNCEGKQTTLIRLFRTPIKPDDRVGIVFASFGPFPLRIVRSCFFRPITPACGAGSSHTNTAVAFWTVIRKRRRFFRPENMVKIRILYTFILACDLVKTIGGSFPSACFFSLIQLGYL